MDIYDLDYKSRLFLERFRNNCSFLCDKKICIYGTGAYTGYILDLFPEYNVVCLTDRDTSIFGKKRFGVPVVSLKDALDYQIDAILIVSFTEFYWGIIFDRIKEQVQDIVDVFYPDGTRPKVNDSVKDDPYWRKSFDELLNKIDRAEVVTFDVFDTLVMRKYALPQDVFAGIEHMSGTIDGFEKYRRQAEEISFRKNGVNSSLDTIYREFMLLTGEDKKKVEEYKELEIATEIKNIFPRSIMIKLYNHARDAGKRVFLLSDMYHSKMTIEKILSVNSIVGYEELWVSCEKGCSKQDGSLWREFIKIVGGNRVLHIGDDLDADIKYAEKNGIEAYHIRSAYRLMLSSSLRAIISNVRCFDESVLLGNILLKLFNDPFCLKDPFNGELFIDRFESLGYLAFGGIMFSYLRWLIDETNSRDIDVILFLARDSHFVMEIYERFCKEFNVKAPRPIYLKTSRVMSRMMQINDETDIERLLRDSYTGYFSSFMEMRFGVVLPGDDLNRDLYVDLPKNIDAIRRITFHYKDTIIENSKNQRSYYAKYLDGLNIKGKKIAFSDIGYSGSNQYYVSKMLDEKSDGFYFNADLTEDNPYNAGNIHALFQKETDLNGSESGAKKWTQLIEAVMTSDEGMYIRCDGYGGFIQDDLNQNQKNYSDKARIHDGIWDCVKDMQTMIGRMHGISMNRIGLFADGILNTVFSRTNSISESIKSVFYVDNAIIGQKETRLF